MRWCCCCFTAVNVFFCHLLLTLDHTSLGCVILQEQTSVKLMPVRKRYSRNFKGLTVGDRGHVHCWRSFSSLSEMFVCMHERTQRCQLVMQQKSTRLDQSESLSHSPRSFCYTTNQPFIKQPNGFESQKKSHFNFNFLRNLQLTKQKPRHQIRSAQGSFYQLTDLRSSSQNTNINF